MKRIIHLSAGIILVALGIVMTPLPIPLGLVMVVLGLSLLVGVVPALRHYLVRIRRHYPVTSQKLRTLNHRLPRFLQPLLTETDPDHPLNQTSH
ncbi:MAG: hypothetical protein CMI00_06240 [Oceanospirillaceae bacterium]|nr:hypothetical protein [Oceanospirillaceae bacterium]